MTRLWLDLTVLLRPTQDKNITSRLQIDGQSYNLNIPTGGKLCQDTHRHSWLPGRVSSHHHDVHGVGALGLQVGIIDFTLSRLECDGGMLQDMRDALAGLPVCSH